jgi:hypothetical protein
MLRLSQMPAHSDTSGIGAQIPTETYGVGPFHGGGGGGGGGIGGGGASATTQVLDAASNTVPAPHSAALLTAGDTSAAIASVANTAAPPIANR